MHLTANSPNRRRDGRRLLPWAILAGGFLAACQITDNRASEPRNELATSAAIQNTTFTDATGKIRIRVKTCDTTAAAFTNCAYCTADDGWVRIGGGASIVGENIPGAMLQASFPSPNFFTSANSFGCTGPAGHSPARLGIDDKATWVARASGATHRLVPYVIEMQLVDPNGIAFAPNVTEGIDRVTDEVNPPNYYTVETRESDLPSGYFLIGGGANIFTSNPSNSITAPTDAYLVGSYPADTATGRAWRATARAQHNVVYNEPMKSYAIGVESCPSQWSGRCFTYPMIKQVTAAATTAYGTAAYTVSPSWVASSVGGVAATTNSTTPRYLADLIPFNGTAKGFTVRSKGNGTGGSGVTVGETLVFGTNAGLYNFNSVVFDQGGLLYRPSGTNPQLQRTSTTGGGLPSTRWNFESFGTGTYRLRNGNPDAGGECAYRDGTTSNVRVTTCGSGNEFKWSIFGTTTPTASLFGIKNLSNGLCLDNNGISGGANSNLVLKACVSGGSGSQQLYLDRYNWP